MKKALLILLLGVLPVSLFAQSNVSGIGGRGGGGASTSAANSWTAHQAFTLGETISGGTSAGVANPSTNFLYFAPAAAGSYEVMRFSNNEAASGDFAFALSNTAGSNGATLRDNQFGWGYNITATFGRQNSGEHAFYEAIESRYRTGAPVDQLEQYYNYQNTSGTNLRPFGITINLGDDSINLALRAQTTVLGAMPDTTYDWLQAESTASSGRLSMSRNSTLNYSGTQTDWITQGGQLLLGFDSGTTTGRLFAGVTSASFFAGAALADGMTLMFGSTATSRGLRWSGGWEFQTGGGTWQKMGVPRGFYTADDGSSRPHSGFGPTAFTPDTSYTVEVYDATASSGNTGLLIRAGAGQSVDLLRVYANNGSTVLSHIDSGGSNYAPSFKVNDGGAALQDYFNTHFLAIGTGGDIGFSTSAAWSGTVDAGLKRGGTNTVKVTDGSTGTGTLITKLPTSCSGLAAGTLYNNAGTPGICP